GVRIDRWVGDGDSIDASALEDLARAGVAIARSPADKDETDAELAVVAAVEAGARRVTIVGAMDGERPDHELGNVWLLAHPQVLGRDARLVGAGARIRLLEPGRADLIRRVG